MKPLRSIVAAGLALAFLSAPAGAITFQVAADTFGSPVTKKIAKTAGVATTLPVSKTSTAYIGFDVGASGIDPNAVTAARLVIYFPRVTKGGNLTLFANNSAFTETFATLTAPTPAVGFAIGSPIPVTTANSKNFLTIDLTSQVIAWLNTPASDFGIGISADSPTSTLSVLIGSKEGSGSGYPAVLEVDVNNSTSQVSGTSGSFGSTVIVDNSASDNANLHAGLLFGGGASGEGIASDRVGTSGRPNQFGLDFFTNSAPRLSITHDGNVGIGTNAPGHPLDVSVGLDDARIVGSGNNGAGLILENTDTSTHDWYLAAAGGSFAFGPQKSFVIRDNTAAATRLVIDTVGNVGIGAPGPTTPLEVNGEIKSSGGAAAFTFENRNNSSFNWQWLADNAGAHFSSSSGNATNALFASVSGNIGIGTSTPSTRLQVAGGIKCNGTVDTSSDARYKLNIEPLSGALAQTLRLRGVSYDWNRAKFPDKGFNDRHQLGFIAQEVREILPDVVSEDPEGYLSIGYSAIIPVLAEAVKELKQQKDAEIAALQAGNDALAQKVTALEARDAAREARLTKLESARAERPSRPINATLEFK